MSVVNIQFELELKLRSQQKLVGKKRIKAKNSFKFDFGQPSQGRTVAPQRLNERGRETRITILGKVAGVADRFGRCQQDRKPQRCFRIRASQGQRLGHWHGRDCDRDRSVDLDACVAETTRRWSRSRSRIVAEPRAELN